jgi:hypothetical protein
MVCLHLAGSMAKLIIQASPQGCIAEAGFHPEVKV